MLSLGATGAVRGCCATPLGTASIRSKKRRVKLKFIDLFPFIRMKMHFRTAENILGVRGVYTYEDSGDA
jgi:hypothetical protein